MKTTKFCPLPWNSINLRNNGDVRICCNTNSYTENRGILKDESGNNLNVRENSFSEIRNAPLLKEVRLAMMNDQWHPECERCRVEEESDIVSRRQYENQSYPDLYDKAIVETLEDGTIPEEFPLEYMDIRYGNFCNLKCRMCGPTDSHMWIPDSYKTGVRSYKETDKVVRIFLKDDKPSIDYDYNWFADNEKFNSEVLSHITEIKKLYIVGGEPLYIQEHYQLLETLAASGHSSGIYLEYNTNMTTFPDKLIELWKSFRGVMVGASIDGYGKVLEYQRYPANWEILYKNLKKLNKLVAESNPIRYYENVEGFQACAWLAFTVTTINVLHVPDFIRWKIEESGLDNFGVSTKPVISHHMCHSPPPLNIRSLHPMLKMTVEEKYEEFLQYSERTYDKKIHNANVKIINSILKFMHGGDLHTEVDGWNRFVKYMKSLDEIRGESLLDTVPEYRDFIK